MSNDRIVIDICDRGFNEVGAGPLRNVRDFRCSDPIDRAGTFSFSVPRSDFSGNDPDSYLRTFLIRVYVDGEIFYTGIIEGVSPSVSQTGVSMVQVSGRSLIAELAEVSVDFLNLSSGSDGVQNGPAQVLGVANFKLTNNWTLATSSATSNLSGILTTASKIYAKFAGESALLALTKIAEYLNGHFVWEKNARQIHYIGNTFNDCGLVAGQGGHDPVGFEANTNECLIQSFSETTDGADIVTRVYPYGGGQGETRLTLQAYTTSPGGSFFISRSGNYVNYNPNNYPRVERHIEFKDITPISNTDADVRAAANALALAAAGYLSRRTQAPKTYRIQLARVPDVGALRPGLYINVLYQDDTYSIDQNLYIMDVQATMGNDGALTHTLTVTDVPAAKPQTAAEWQANQMQQGQVFQSHQQMGPNVTTIAYREALDDDYDANMRFWLGDEIAQIQQVLLRYRVDPLRSTVKSSGGTSTSTGASSTSSSGASSSSTTAGGGSSSPTSGTGDHVHPISIPAGTIVGNIGVDASNNIVNGASVVGVTDTDVESGGHTHSVTVPSHTHGMSHTHNIDHTHDVTATINTAYGVFEESGANTYAIGDLSVAINGVTLPPGQRQDLGGGWYAYDLTDEVQNPSTLRPTSEANTVSISQTPDADKTAQISAQIQVRSIIQSVSYS